MAGGLPVACLPACQTASPVQEKHRCGVTGVRQGWSPAPHPTPPGAESVSPQVGSGRGGYKEQAGGWKLGSADAGGMSQRPGQRCSWPAEVDDCGNEGRR